MRLSENISNLDKMLSMIAKAQDVLLDAADILDGVLSEATAVGGQIAQIVPSHIENLIEKISALVESNDPSSLSSLDDLISNMPIRSVKSQSPSERRASRQATVDLAPNTQAGPRSQIAARESFDWRTFEKDEPEYNGNALNWDRLTESELFDHSDEEPLIEVRGEPIDKFAYRGKIREAVNNDANDASRSADGEQLTESLEAFDLGSMVGIAGTVEGLPSFGAIANSELKVIA
jgi:hypothetical protein